MHPNATTIAHRDVNQEGQTIHAVLAFFGAAAVLAEVSGKAI